jgi:DNA-directed RNA polymerase specialized sigma subunit
MENKERNNTKRKTTMTKKSMREASLQEIGDKLGLTRMRICQLEKFLLEKIKKSGMLDEFKQDSPIQKD